MTKKEIELRLVNVEKAVSDLARKQTDRDNRAENKINDAGMSIDSLNSRSTEQGEQIISAEQSITDLDLQNIETEQTLTDIDLRLLVLEG